MRRVAGKEGPPLPIGRCQPPMDAIGSRLQHIDAIDIGNDVAQQILQPVIG